MSIFPDDRRGIGHLLEPFGGICPEADGGKGEFHRIRRAQMLPVWLPKLIEGGDVPNPTRDTGRQVARGVSSPERIHRLSPIYTPIEATSHNFLGGITRPNFYTKLGTAHSNPASFRPIAE